MLKNFQKDTKVLSDFLIVLISIIVRMLTGRLFHKKVRSNMKRSAPPPKKKITRKRVTL